MATKIVDGLSTPQVAALSGVAPSTLDYWVRAGLVAPTLRPGAGRRFTRYWAVTDVIVVRAVKSLRDAGCPLQKVREARAVIDRLSADHEDTVVLYWDGADVLAVEPWGDVYSAIQRPGQQVLHLLALPLRHWRDEANATAVEIDLAAVRARRAARVRSTAPSQAIRVRGRRKSG